MDSSTTDKVCLHINHEGLVQRLKYYRGTPSSDLLEVILQMFNKISRSSSQKDIDELKRGCMFRDEDGDVVCFAPDLMPTNTKLYLHTQCVSESLPQIDANPVSMQQNGHIKVKSESYHPAVISVLDSDSDEEARSVNPEHSCSSCMKTYNTPFDPLLDQQASPVNPAKHNHNHCTSSGSLSKEERQENWKEVGGTKSVYYEVGSSSSTVGQQHELDVRPVRERRSVERLITQQRVPLKAKSNSSSRGCGCSKGCISKHCKCKKNGKFCRSECECRKWGGCYNQKPSKVTTETPWSQPLVRYGSSSYWTWDPEINCHPNIMYTLTEGNLCVSAPTCRENSRLFVMPVLCGTRSFSRGKHRWICEFTNRSTTTLCLFGLISKLERDQIKYADYGNISSQYPLLQKFSYFIDLAVVGDIKLSIFLDMDEKTCTVKQGVRSSAVSVKSLPDDVWPAVAIKFTGSRCACRVSFDV